MVEAGEKQKQTASKLNSAGGKLRAGESNIPKIKNEIVQAADDIESSCNSMTEMGDKMIDTGKKMS
jgi:hypothetical protein